MEKSLGGFREKTDDHVRMANDKAAAAAVESGTDEPDANVATENALLTTSFAVT